MSTEHIETVIIGAGQAGLSTAYHLTTQGRACVVLDSNARIGDNWRRHWDTLRLYSPAKYDGLPGMPFPADPWTFPQKDQVAAFQNGFTTLIREFIVAALELHELPDDENPDELTFELSGIILAANANFVLRGDQATLDMAKQVVRRRLSGAKSS